ncbi:MAG TPA: hypothetical protein VMT87_15715 [Vicinamibacteria bacterium]|nr:hypothetical protein [Vicinamibacteria bacterium]
MPSPLPNPSRARRRPSSQSSQSSLAVLYREQKQYDTLRRELAAIAEPPAPDATTR